jgi:hypothetical protein
MNGGGGATAATWVSVAVALIAAVAILGAALLTSGAARRRERAARHAEAEQAALELLVQAAVDWRQALRTIEWNGDTDLVRFDRCGALFLVRREAVAGIEVRDRALAWHQRALDRYGDPAADGGEETSLWEGLLGVIGRSQRAAR